ncbi:hypothetical protein V1477_016426, partial [Vespula maculifrons]
FLDWKHERNEQALFLLGINALVLYAKAFPRSVENQKDARSLTQTEAQGLSFVFPISKATIRVDIPDDGFRAVNWITSALIQFYAC